MCVTNFVISNLLLVYSLQGRRPTMEDRFIITESLPPVIDNVSPKLKESNSIPDLQRRQSIKIYGVFDGHGGEVQKNYKSFDILYTYCCNKN